MINFCLDDAEKTLLKSLIGKRLVRIKHDPLDKFGQETVYGRVELFFDGQIILVGYDYAPYPLFGGKDDHPKFYIKQITENEAVSALQDTTQINIRCGQIIKGVSLVEDYTEAEWDNKKDDVRVLKAIIFKFDGNEIAIQGDYMIPLLDILKGDNVARKFSSPGDEFDKDPETKRKSERFFIDL